MRFAFVAGDTRDNAERDAMLSNIDASLALVSEALSGTAVSDARACARAREAVARIDARLELEVVPERDGSHTLVITPRGERCLRPLVDAIVSRAPALDGCRWVTHRPPRSFEEMCETVRQAHAYELADARARAGFSRGHLLDVVVYADRFGGAHDEPALFAAELAVETLLGERIFDDWIGSVSAEPAPRGGPLRVVGTAQAPHFALSELPRAIAAAVEGLRRELPTLAASGAVADAWTLFEVEPEATSDYPAQDDAALVASALPEMTKCFLEGAPFSSLRFSRGGERFAYLKIDAKDAPFERRLGQRTKLEEQLGRALAHDSLGVVVGNGLGIRYIYVTLALAADGRAHDIVTRVARECGAPTRSWLLFCDTDLADEWIGVWPESPRPPR